MILRDKIYSRYSYGLCSFSHRLQIYDGLTVATPLSPDQGLFGDYRHNDMGPHNKISKGIYDYVSTNRALTLSYVGKPTKHFPGFKVLITAFRGTDF